MLKIKLVMMLFLSFVIISCDDEENDTDKNLEINQENLVGAWNYNNTKIGGVTNNLFDEIFPRTVILNANNTCEFEYTDNSQNFSGTWTLDENDLLTAGNEDNGIESTVSFLSENKMELSGDFEGQEYISYFTKNSN